MTPMPPSVAPLEWDILRRKIHLQSLRQQNVKDCVQAAEYALKGELNIDSAVDDIAQALYCACRIPLVFGADKLHFRRRKKVDHVFGQYLDFIKLAIIRFYEQADHNVEKACDTIRDLLKNPKFEEFFKESEETTKHCVTILPQKNLVEIAAATVEGIFKPDYYGKSDVAYAQSPDELFSIVTETSQENEAQDHTPEENGESKAKEYPQTLMYDMEVGYVRFQSKEQRNEFLTIPNVIKLCVSEMLKISSDQIILVVPKDAETLLEPSNFKEIL